MRFKNYIYGMAMVLAAMFLSQTASAQYYEIANRIPSLIQPAISGSMKYKGFVDAGYSKTLGNYDADFLEVSTSQGFQYTSWFYMGVGIGADVLFAHKNDTWGDGWDDPSYGKDHGSTTTAVMLPLFTDFRFNLGKNSGASFFIDLRLGCSFLLSNKYISIGDGYLTNQEYFYLRPSLGIRIPTNSKNTKQALDLGITYKLLTSNYWNSWNRDITLNSLGVTIAYEW